MTKAVELTSFKDQWKQKVGGSIHNEIDLNSLNTQFGTINYISVKTICLIQSDYILGDDPTQDLAPGIFPEYLKLQTGSFRRIVRFEHTFQVYLTTRVRVLS